VTTNLTEGQSVQVKAARSSSARRRLFPKIPSFWISVMSIVGGLLIWEAAVPLFDLNKLIIAQPSAIYQGFDDLIGSGELWRHFKSSMTIFAVGFSFAVVVGVGLGLAIGQFRIVRRLFDPWISAFYATPNIALAPLFIIWLGYGFNAKVTTVAFIATFPIVINTSAGVDSVLTEWTDVGSAFKVNRRERFFKINLPGALPFIFLGLRLGVGRGLVGIVVADLFGSQEGLGFLIFQSAQSFRTPNVFVGTFTLAIVGVALSAVFRVAERIATPYRQRT
jgi:NitT/TauT family transport system permease protein